jgi:phosphotriesterase-related protein
MLQTVTGLVDIASLGLVDAHGHVWIDPPNEALLEIVLHDRESIVKELRKYRESGGTAIVDCQPAGCGRDANKLREISEASGVFITATTGYHQKQYYAPDYWLWTAKANQAADFFIEELTKGMRETGGRIRATNIKIAFEGTISGQTQVLMEAAADAAKQTGAAILVHTEKGNNIEALLPFFQKHDISPSRLFLCHVDKRPDFGLHKEMVQAGALLGYDTFNRPKYRPEGNGWPLLIKMMKEGFKEHIAVALDLANAAMWKFNGATHGMMFLAEQIRPRLVSEGFSEEEIKPVLGANITRHLTRQKPQSASSAD